MNQTIICDQCNVSVADMHIKEDEKIHSFCKPCIMLSVHKSDTVISKILSSINDKDKQNLLSLLIN
jgi:hypothetical protein